MRKLHRLEQGDGRLLWIDEFLAGEECQRLLEELEFAFWSPSGVSYRLPERGLRNGPSANRLSETAMQQWFSSFVLRALKRLDRRLEALVPGFAARREGWQATRYRRGGKFDYHLDCGHWAQERAGDREHTVLLYLNQPRAGGSTHFKRLSIDVQPRVGRLVVWRNLDRNRQTDPEMLHSSTPVRAGRKTVLVTWVRQRAHQEGKHP